MTVLDALKDIQRFLQDQVERLDITLQREEGEDYVRPYVELCYLPHKNFTPTVFQTPGVLVCMDGASDDGDASTVSVRLVCSAYGGGFYEESQIPDAKGYLDLINLMERLRIALWSAGVVGRCALTKPISMGMYDTELAWPYWYGFLEFDVSVPYTQHPLDLDQDERNEFYGL